MNDKCTEKNKPFDCAEFNEYSDKRYTESINQSTPKGVNSSSKIYSKSLTLLLPILKMIDAGLRQSEISQTLDISKSHVSYYVRKATGLGYIKSEGRDVFQQLKLTQAGKNFVDQYTNPLSNKQICRLENIRFKAPILSMPANVTLVDWKKVGMNNWAQYNSMVDSITVHLNLAKEPTIEFIPSPVDGDDPFCLREMVFHDCVIASQTISQRLRIEIGRLVSNSRPEYVVYDPVAKAFSKNIGQVDIKGVGKVNASKPGRIGEFEFSDPLVCAAYMSMPKRLEKIEQDLEEFKELLKETLENIRFVNKPKPREYFESIRELR